MTPAATHWPEFLSREDIMRIMGCAQSTVDEWLRAGELSRFKMGRFVRISRSGFLDFLERKTLEPLARQAPLGGNARGLAPSDLVFLYGRLERLIEMRLHQIYEHRVKVLVKSGETPGFDPARAS